MTRDIYSLRSELLELRQRAENMPPPTFEEFVKLLDLSNLSRSCLIMIKEGIQTNKSYKTIGPYDRATGKTTAALYIALYNNIFLNKKVVFICDNVTTLQHAFDSMRCILMEKDLAYTCTGKNSYKLGSKYEMCFTTCEQNDAFFRGIKDCIVIIDGFRQIKNTIVGIPILWIKSSFL